MNEAHDHGITSSHGQGTSNDVTIPGGPGKPPLHFSPEEWLQFRKSDAGAGKSVVMLMGGIFSIGLALYSLVAYVCWFRLM